MGHDTGTTIRQIVRNDHRAAAVFEKYAIDFCCGGDASLDAACASKGIDPAPIQRELQGLNDSPADATFRPAEWDLDVLADYIVNNHHRYVRRALPRLAAHLEKVVSAHGSRHPELVEIARSFQSVEQELTNHMQKEELVLFPHIRNLARAQAGMEPARPPFGSVRNPIRMMEAEHQSAGIALSLIRRLSGDLTPPPDACETYRVAYKELGEFERDLHQHIHLENNVLFPKAIELEETLFA